METYFTFLFAVVATAATVLAVVGVAFFLLGIYKAVKRELFDT